MELINTKAELIRYLALKRKNNLLIGLVPTMGYLHLGHQSLIEKAVQENQVVVVSDFINPTQFNEAADFESYPKDINRDLKLAEAAGAEVLFMPDLKEMYPFYPNIDIKITINNSDKALFNDLEAKYRPGHFDGVVTVVAKLFALVRPDKAYFGEKDFQQLLIVKRLAEECFPTIDVVGCPTVREPSGLALSSRNARLSEKQKQVALVISQALFAAKDALDSGERDPKLIEELMQREIEKEQSLSLEYAVCRNDSDLEPMSEISDNARLLIAARLSSIRLIDNLGWQRR